jgi:predicted ArsR family transcriptional regulator
MSAPYALTHPTIRSILRVARARSAGFTSAEAAYALSLGPTGVRQALAWLEALGFVHRHAVVARAGNHQTVVWRLTPAGWL